MTRAEQDVVVEYAAGAARLVVVASRLPRGSRVAVRPRDERRLGALLGHARQLALEGVAEARDAAAEDEWPPTFDELCSAHFISGAGWAWRVTAALAQSRPKSFSTSPATAPNRAAATPA